VSLLATTKMDKPIEEIYIGIDTGVNTGLAAWSKSRKSFIKIETCKIHTAIMRVLQYFNNPNFRVIRVRVEDARKRSRSKSDPNYYTTLQGAGSVKRDAIIWEDMLKDYAIPYEMVAPQSNTTKTTVEAFKKMTGLYVPSNHSRDAAMLVFNF